MTRPSVLYLPDDEVRFGEIASDRGPLPMRYISGAVLGLKDFEFDVDVYSIDGDDGLYRAVRGASRHRYNRYIKYKIGRQALQVILQGHRYDFVIAGRATAAAIGFLGWNHRSTKVVSVWYVPSQYPMGRVTRRRNSSLSAVFGVSANQAPVLRASLPMTGTRVLTLTMGVDHEFFQRSAARPPAGPWVVVGDEHRDERLLRAVVQQTGLDVVRISPALIGPELRIPGVEYRSSLDAVELRHAYEDSSGALVLTDNWVEIPGLTVIMEAMSMGLPLVATRSQATAEYIREGVNGYVVPFFDVGATVRALRAATELGPQLGVAGRNLVERHHTISHGAEQLARGLESLL